MDGYENTNRLLTWRFRSFKDFLHFILTVEVSKGSGFLAARAPFLLAARGSFLAAMAQGVPFWLQEVLFWLQGAPFSFGCKGSLFGCKAARGPFLAPKVAPFWQQGAPFGCKGLLFFWLQWGHFSAGSFWLQGVPFWLCMAACPCSAASGPFLAASPF